MKSKRRKKKLYGMETNSVALNIFFIQGTVLWRCHDDLYYC